MPTHRQDSKADWRRVLELLASCPDGTTDTLLLTAHGLTTKTLVELIRAGLATAHQEKLVIAGRTTKLMRVRITEAGREVLQEC
jgi:hypothetical protein